MTELPLQLFVVVGAIAVAPIVAAIRRVVMPLVVVELLLGILAGPLVLGWIEPVSLEGLKEAGRAILFLMVGFHIYLTTLMGTTLRRFKGAPPAALEQTTLPVELTQHRLAAHGISSE